MNDLYSKYMLDNKYSLWYFRIIENALSRAKTRRRAKYILGYVESHHIIPKSMAPELEAEKDNIVHLTAREHFICHLLLTKAVKDEYITKMKFAFSMMFKVNGSHNRYVNSLFYEKSKIMNAEASIERNKSRKYARGYSRTLSDETKLKIGKSNKGSICVKNVVTGKISFIKPGEEIAEGYIKSKPEKLLEKSNEAITGSRYIYNVSTGEEKRVKLDELPEGWRHGRSTIFITNGIETKMINKVVDEIPHGWTHGRHFVSKKDARRKNSNKRIQTPLGNFDHVLSFCEKYKIDVSFFSNLNTKIRNRSSNEFLRKCLIEAGVDMNLTKAEMGFIFL